MSPHIVCIVGLPASGKTTQAKNEWADHYLLEDPFTAEEAEETLKRDRVVIIHPNFCLATSRMAFERLLGRPVEWVFFENNPTQCVRNAKNRPGVGELIHLLSRVYHIPPGVVPRPVWKAED